MKELAQATIEKWLSKTIVELNLCPFAKVPWKNSQISIKIDEASGLEEAYPSFVQELETLHASDEVVTTIIAYSHLSIDFLDFNDWVGELEKMLSENDLSSTFQLVAFHPKFIFAGLDQNDLANWVNRSPYPVIHILRFEDVKNALRDEHFAKEISFNNEQNIKSLTESKRKEYFWYLYP